jgi:hypothetical protein
MKWFLDEKKDNDRVIIHVDRLDEFWNSNIIQEPDDILNFTAVIH